MNGPAPVRGRVDGDGRLVAADPRLASLNSAAGGVDGGPLAIPQVAALARLARRLGITISRSAVAAEGERDIDLWVRAEPVEGGVELALTGWSERPAAPPAPAPEAERQADFLRASADWIWEVDQALRFTSLSPAAAAAMGRNPADYIGQQLTALFRLVEDEAGGLPILAALAGQSRFDTQLADLRATRRGRYRLAGVPLIDGNGRFAGFRGSATSIPQIVRSAEFAPPAEAGTTNAFGERLDMALRAPLAHIIANAETIGAQPDGPIRGDYAGYATDIAAAGRHLLSLVDDLVDLQAIERPDFRAEEEEIDLADVARRAVGLLAVRAAAKGVTIDRPGSADSLPASGEFKRALQIVVNLLTNAIRYSPEGSMVWVRTDREGDLGALIIADQGKGIGTEDQVRIFDKFKRVDASEAGGTGLGLYIARRLARAMGGDISVDSAPGQGARFTFTLPLRA